MLNANSWLSIHPAVYRAGQNADLFAGSNSLCIDARAIALNDKGEMIVNVSDASHSLHSYLYKPSGPDIQNYYAFDLPKLPDGSRMIGTALNKNGQIVGGGYLDDNGVVKSLASLLLTSSGWSNLVATAISDKGQIVGQGQIDGQHAFLLSPDPSNVPEPARYSSGVSWEQLLSTDSASNPADSQPPESRHEPSRLPAMAG
jgi:uncharacterized membrane protein